MAKRRSKHARSDGKNALRIAWMAITSSDWPFEPEHKFALPERNWRFDWAHVPTKLAIEVEGVTYYGAGVGRHQSAKGIEADMEKYNSAIVRGWRVLRFSQRMIASDPHAVIETILDAAKQGASNA